MNERLRQILEKTLDSDIASLEKEGDFRNSEYWDSLRYVNLVVALENEFKIKLGRKDIQEILSVAQVREVMKRHGVED